MRLSLSTGCLAHLPLRQTFQLAARAGFEGVELVMAPEIWIRGARYVAGLTQAYSLPVLSVHQALMGISPAGRGPQRIVDAVEMALRLDAPCVVMHGTWATRWGSARAQRWLRALDGAQRRLSGSGTHLSIENQGIYSLADGHSLLAPLPLLVSFADRHGLSITLDTCHLGTAGIGLLDAYASVGARLCNLHLSDLGDAKLLLNARPLRTLLVHHQMPGEGGLPLATLLARVAEDGYTGPVILEISPVSLRAWSTRRIGERLEQAARFVRQAATGSP